MTPLEIFFVQEFCRSARISPDLVSVLKVKERSRNPVGFMTAIIPSSVAEELRFDGRVFSSARVAHVGPDRLPCGMVLFFDEVTGMLDAIEGFAYGEEWPSVEEPIFWSEPNEQMS
ncbi:hypothetical protein [Mesorhizobium sp. B2-3-5]|uniref:hypothetical protein n=1 Tax=Mesorhizobium sp. B2-3-5 TaxID=2589958 RepID=UPI00112ECF70|nr:hypothetical protein [Mesorhizobium sp. B2-3-5]TPM27992.1 hypothetical protein FJ958_16655 [Mesorhizobium sp. B2-3-5]